MKRDVAFLVGGAVLSAILGFAVLSSRSVIAFDYRAFYCAGQAIRHHANPYHTTSLRECELGITDQEYRTVLTTAVLPAPQPLYDTMFFAVLSTLPFALSKGVCGAILGISIFVTAAALMRLTGLSPPVIFAVLVISLIDTSLSLGQIIPIYTAAAAVAALLAKEGKYEWAGAIAPVSLVEPHLGAPICAALVLLVPRSRATVGAGVGALALLAYLGGGIQTNVEYITTVLPLHALSELGSDRQFSLSVILNAIHVPPGAAIKIGAMSYLCVTTVGIWIARVARVRFANAAFVVAIPAATAAVGGPFLHDTDIVAAIPLALLVLPTDFRGAAAAALVLLGTTWLPQPDIRELMPWFAFCGAIAGYLIRKCAHGSIAVSGVCALLVFSILVVGNVCYANVKAPSQKSMTAAVIDNTYPEASWARVSEEAMSKQSVWGWLTRIPTWGGLVLLMSITVASMRQERSEPGPEWVWEGPGSY